MSNRTVIFPAELLDRLAPHAERRGTHPNTLAHPILEAVVDDDLVNAVLDDATEDADG